MRAAFAPIKAGGCEAAPQGPLCFNVDAEGVKTLRAGWGQIVGALGGFARVRQPTESMEAVVEQDSDGAGDVVVTGARGAQAVGCVGHKLFARAAGEDA